MGASLANGNLSDNLAASVAVLNADSTLALYVADVEPSPSLLLGDYVEAVYAGYARAVLSGGWETVPVKEGEGIYRVRSSVVAFPVPDAGSITVRGVVLLGSEDEVIGAARFPAPVDLVAGSDPLVLRVARRNLA